MIFIQALYESLVQVDDMTRINVEKTFITPDEAAITKIEIQPEATESFYDVTSNKYLDWSYSSAATKTVTARVTTDSTPVTKEFSIVVVSEDTDSLFSKDSDIVNIEANLERYLQEGRSSFINFHRIAQGMILDSIAQRGITDYAGSRIDKTNIVDIEEMKEWSKYLCLYLIFKSVQSESGDVYGDKAQSYYDMATRSSERAFLRLDLNKDGVTDTYTDMVSGSLVRR